jgi:hypothetical protein
VYIPHLRIEIWGTRAVVVGLGEQATQLQKQIQGSLRYGGQVRRLRSR